MPQINTHTVYGHSLTPILRVDLISFSLSSYDDAGVHPRDHITLSSHILTVTGIMTVFQASLAFYDIGKF